MSIVTIRRWIHAPLGTAPIRTSRVQPCAILVRVLSRGVNEKLIKYRSAYFTSLVSAILVLYSPEDVISSFFAQLLNVYSLIVAAIIAIAGHNLTKLHSVVALTLAASPLSLYLILYVFRSLLGKQTRLQAVFGPGMHLNRALVLIMLPLWAGVLAFTILPTSAWQFQQAACDLCVPHLSLQL